MQLHLPRFTIRRAMVAVAIVAVVLGAVRYKMAIDARAKIARLKADLSRAEARMAWVLAMKRKEYVLSATVSGSRALLAKIRAEIKGLEGH
jgi:hypothetical protein